MLSINEDISVNENVEKSLRKLGSFKAIATTKKLTSDETYEIHEYEEDYNHPITVKNSKGDLEQLTFDEFDEVFDKSISKKVKALIS